MPHQLSLHAPLFDLTLFEADGQISAVEWGWADGGIPSTLLRMAKAELDTYFDGDKTDAFTLPIAPDPNPTRERVWQALCAIPYGTVENLTEFASKHDIPLGQLEVILSQNPCPILVPCHRLVRDKNSMDLGPYSGEGGPDTKKALLVLEGVIDPE